MDNEKRFHLSHLRPLPEDIARMSEDETACQYCGISYLLLTKYEQMESHMKDLERELQKLREYVEERPILLAKIDALAQSEVHSQNDINRLEKSLKDWQQRHHEQSLSLEKAQETSMREKQDLIHRHEAAQNQTVRTIHSTTYDLLQLQNELSKVKGTLQSNIKVTFPSMLNRLSQEMKESFSRIVVNERRLASQAVEKKVEATVSSLHAQIEHLSSALEDTNARNERLASELSASRQEYSHQVIGHKSYVQGLQASNLILEDRNLKANKEIMSLSAEKERLYKQSSDLASKLESFKLDQQNSTESLERVNLDLKRQLTLKDSEWSKDLDKLKRQLTESTIVQSDSEGLKQAHLALAKKDEQMMAMERAVRELNGNLTEMRVERTKTIEAHNSRIKQLQDKFLEDLKEAGKVQWDQREQELRLSLAKETEESIDKIKSESKRELEDAKNKLQTQNHSLTTSVDSLTMQVSRFKRIEKDLKTQVSNIESDVEKKKGELQALQTRFNNLAKELAMTQARPRAGPESENTIKELKIGLAKKDAEILFLKETVRLECEERMGLIAMVASIKRESQAQIDLQLERTLIPSKSAEPSHDAKAKPPRPKSRPSSAASVVGRHGSKLKNPPLTLPTGSPDPSRFEMLIQAASARKEKKLARQKSVTQR